MTAGAGDFIKASVSVRLGIEQSFRLFTEQIDQWWRRGPRYRNGGPDSGLIHLEPRLDGRVFESSKSGQGERVFEIGRIVEWSPPARLAFTWRNSVFADDEMTLVEVDFTSQGASTLVTVVHRGWAAIRPDHPARHGMQIPAFQRSLGVWWGDQLSSLRSLGK